MSLNLPIKDSNLYQILLEHAGGRKLCIVGGYVRDILLGAPTKDLDFVIDSGLPEFLDKALVKLEIDSGTKVSVSHSRFLTAKLNFEKPFHGHSTLDFSQARKETYPGPASRPVVTEGKLEQDILRRDFTINSVAIFGDQLIDVSNGKADLRSKLIRIHHKDSFRDDPIRLSRAVRFLVRLGFSLEKNTAECFDKAATENFLSLVSVRRRFEELRKVLRESKRNDSLIRLQEAGLLKVLCPAVLSNLPALPDELSAELALKSIVEKDSETWDQYVDSLGLPKEENKRLKS